MGIIQIAKTVSKENVVIMIFLSALLFNINSPYLIKYMDNSNLLEVEKKEIEFSISLQSNFL